MKFTCERDAFAKGVSAVSRVIPSRGPLPILSNVLIAAEGEVLKLSGTDLEVGIRLEIPAQVHQPGSTTVSGKRLAEILAKLPNSNVEIVVEKGDRVQLKCERSKFTLPGLTAAEFPPMAIAKYNDAAGVVSIPAQALVRALKSVDFASAKDEKSVISGVRFIVKDGKMDLAATDGYRLARFTCDIESEGVLSAVVPGRAFKELEKLIGPEKSDVFISIENNQILFVLGDRQMSSRLLDGNFPNIEQIIPATFDRSALIDRSFMRLAMERVAIMASEREAKRMDIGFTKGEVILKANSAELGESTDVIPAEYDADDFAIAFNSTYFLEGLRALEGETLEVQMNGALSPVVLRSPQSEEQFYLLMPIRN